MWNAVRLAHGWFSFWAVNSLKAGGPLLFRGGRRIPVSLCLRCSFYIWDTENEWLFGYWNLKKNSNHVSNRCHINWICKRSKKYQAKGFFFCNSRFFFGVFFLWVNLTVRLGFAFLCGAEEGGYTDRLHYFSYVPTHACISYSECSQYTSLSQHWCFTVWRVGCIQMRGPGNAGGIGDLVLGHCWARSWLP